MIPLRKRALTLVLVLGISGALLGALNVAVHRVLFVSFAKLERDEGERGVQQMLKALQADLNQLAISTHDYAAWDDAYIFAGDRNQRFVDSNFAVETLANMNVDVVWMIDNEDRDIVAMERADSQQTGLPPAMTAEVSGLLRAQLPLLRSHPDTPVLSRLVRTHEGLLAFAAHPVLPTGGHGTARALLVFGRFLDEEVLARARETSQRPVDLFASPAARARLPEAAQVLWKRRPAETSTVLVPTSSDSLSGFALIRDIGGAPAAIVSTRINRTLLAYGRQTEHYLEYLFAAVVGLFAAAVVALVLYLEKIGRSRMLTERRYRAVITEAQETMLLVDAGTREILEANPAATNTLGYTPAELMRMPIDELFYACDGDILKPVQPELHAAANLDRILIVRRKDRKFIDVEVTANPLLTDDGQVISFVLRDVSARKKAERELVHNQGRLTHLAHHDALTGLLNRLGLERRLPTVIANAHELSRSVAFMYLDIDHFKKINDLRGHACGDRLLQVAASRLQGCLAADDLIVRMGGDEFVVVAPELREPADAALIAARIREKLGEPFEVNGERLQVTSSVGVSVYPQDGADYELLLKNADIALYEAKDAGRDTFVIFSSTMTERVSKRLALEHELREAIRDGQFYLDYQPLIDLQTHRIASLEALVRWHHPIRGRVPPAEFIDIAEKAGLVADIGEFVLREACRQIGEWKLGGARVVPVAVNVSTRQFERQSILRLIDEATRVANITPSLLHVEITESAFMDGHERHVQLLQDLRALGVEVAVDDFGTGYSSLAYLKHLPIDCLKIDRAFVRDIDAGKNDDAIVSAIIRMASSLGLSTVAEGVETQVQATRLRELGATYAQGFYFSRPLAADVCGRLLEQTQTTQRTVIDTPAPRVRTGSG
jgi:diguanylate cyclase (GGDEF)-like protein/PAS domain S-box-containing protein